MIGPIIEDLKKAFFVGAIILIAVGVLIGVAGTLLVRAIG